MIPTIQKNYQRRDGRFAMVYNAPLIPRGNYTANTTGDIFEMGDLMLLRLDLTVASAAGTTPTLDVTIEHSPDAVTWATLGTFTQVTAAGSAHKTFVGADRFVRARLTVGGATPNFDASLGGEAV